MITLILSLEFLYISFQIELRSVILQLDSGLTQGFTMSLSIDSGSDDRDIEAGDDEEEGDEKVDNEKRMKEEEEMKKAKERQAFLENLYVLICMIIIVAMAVVIVFVKVNIFKTDPNITFIPLDQQVIL